MNTDYDRKVYVNGLALGSADFFEVDQVRLDAMPQKNVSTTELADTSGEYLLGQKFTFKPVFLKGHFEAPQRWDYERGRDKLAYLLNSYKEVEIVVEQSGEMRRFKGLYENVRFEYKERGFVMVEIDFRITGAFGESVEKDKPLDDHHFTELYDGSFTVDGSIETPPVMNMSVENIQPDDTPVNMTIIFNSNEKRSRIDINRIWSANDNLVIDSAKKEVKVNNEIVEYSGMFPMLLGDIDFSVFSDSTQLSGYVTIEYNRRWL